MSDWGKGTVQLEQMRYLVEIVKYKSLTEASRNLHVSQQALSSSMAKLEAELGYAVLLRNTKGVRLTVQGEVLAKGFNRLLYELNYLLLETQGQPVYWSKQVVCASSHGMMEAFLADLAEQLTDDDHFEALEIMEDTPEAVVEQVLNRQVDLGIVSYNDYETPQWQNDERLQFISLFSSKLYVRIAKKLPLSNLQSISVKSLRKENILVYQPKHWRANSLCETIRHFCPDCQFSYEESYFLHLQKIRKGLGIAFTIQDGPFIKRYDEKRGFYLIPIKEMFLNFIGILVLKENISPAVQYMISCLQIACANNNGE